MHGSTKPHPVSTWIFAGSGIWLIALGLYFAVLRPPRLPEDLRFMGTTLALPALVWLAGLASYVARP